MKIRKIIAIILLAATLSAVCACTVKIDSGDSVTTNIARVFTTDDRVSKFVKDGVQLEGSVKGKAEVDVSAYSNTTLAWVDNMVVYFVSEKGIDQLGTDISSAEISFDGACAYYLTDSKFMRFDAADRRSTVLDDGISAVYQIAISPSSKCAVLTGLRVGEATKPFTALYRDGACIPLFEGREVTVIAISDDGKICYYIDEEQHAFCVSSGGYETIISIDCDGTSTYNFSHDLSEATYITKDRSNRLFRLSDKLDVELCEGFGYTLKTDVYSIARGTYPAYINQVNSFTNGLWLRRKQQEGVNFYDIGLVDQNGGMKWLAENCRKYKVIDSQSRILWTAGGKLYSTSFAGRTKQLADEVVTFTAMDDGSYTYYISSANSIFAIKGKGGAKKLDTHVYALETIGDYCYYIKDKAEGEAEETTGKLCRANGTSIEEVMENAVRFDKRCGQLMVYTEPVKEGEDIYYDVYFTADGLEWKLMGSRVEP